MEDRADLRRRARAGLLGIFHYRQLLANLILKDLKLKYRGSSLGFLWSLLNPLVMVSVYTVAFTYIMRVSDSRFVFRTLVGLLAWGFFSGSITMATGAIIDNRGLIKSVFFPRIVLPIATVMFNLAQFLLNLLVFLPMMLVLFSVAPAMPIVAFPFFLAMHVGVTTGLALAVASATTSFRDVRHLVDVGLSVLFWATPIVYSYQQVPAPLRPAIMLGPLSPFVIAYQQIFVYGQWPAASLWAIAAIYGAVVLVAGALFFTVQEHRFAEQV